MRRRLQPAWVATIRVSVPIDTTPQSLEAAQRVVNALDVPIGATIEIINQNFGRMRTPAVVAPSVPSTDDGAASGGACPQPAPPLATSLADNPALVRMAANITDEVMRQTELDGPVVARINPADYLSGVTDLPIFLDRRAK